PPACRASGDRTTRSSTACDRRDGAMWADLPRREPRPRSSWPPRARAASDPIPHLQRRSDAHTRGTAPRRSRARSPWRSPGTEPAPPAAGSAQDTCQTGRSIVRFEREPCSRNPLSGRGSEGRRSPPPSFLGALERIERLLVDLVYLAHRPIPAEVPLHSLG